jgi:hypothetical protein
MENTAIVYQYFDKLSLVWDGTESTVDGLRQEIDWGQKNIRNRAGVFLISDPDNTCNVRFFFDPRDAMPTGPTGSLPIDEPIIEEIDANNRSRRLFFIGPNSSIYAEPTAYQGASGVPFTKSIRIFVYQVAGVPVKYFGL